MAQPSHFRADAQPYSKVSSALSIAIWYNQWTKKCWSYPPANDLQTYSLADRVRSELILKIHIRDTKIQALYCECLAAIDESTDVEWKPLDVQCDQSYTIEQN